MSLKMQKKKYVEKCLKSDLDRNSTLGWVEKQNPQIKSLNELKSTLENTLAGLEKTAYQTECRRKSRGIVTFPRKIGYRKEKACC